MTLFQKAVEALKVNECTQEVWNSNLDNSRRGIVIVVSGVGSKKVNDWVVYETSLERYKQAQ